MNIRTLFKRNTRDPHIGWLIFSAMVITILLVYGILQLINLPPTSNLRENSLTLGLIIILGVSVLAVLLFIMAAAFYSLNLTDRQQALGLPSGSIRAMVALLLIVIWAIVSIFIVRLFAIPVFVNNKLIDFNADAIKMAQQLFTTMSTLVVAIAAFYFGSKSVSAAQTALAPSSEQPVITNIIPNSVDQGKTDIHLTILGKNFGSPRSIRLVKEQEQIKAGPPTYTQSDISIIECTFSIEANQTTGKWDVIVVNYDGTEVKFERGFEVTKPSPSTAPG